jgi:hypothetical protein
MIRSRPCWPDALRKQADQDNRLNEWFWALERLEKSHSYCLATSRPEKRPI